MPKTHTEKPARFTNIVAALHRLKHPALLVVLYSAATAPILAIAWWVIVTDPEQNAQRAVRVTIREAADHSTPSAWWNPEPTATPNQGPQMAVVLTEVGLESSITQSILSALPASITLAFSPYGDAQKTSARMALNRGFELLLDIPLEPYDFPRNDPGPHRLLVGDRDGTNRENLAFLLKRFPEARGVAAYGGEAFLDDASSLAFLSQELGRRGLILANLNPRQENRLSELAQRQGLTYLEADLAIDAIVEPDAIDLSLQKLIDHAQSKGVALGVARPFPIVLERLQVLPARAKAEGITLVPLSSLRAPDVQPK